MGGGRQDAEDADFFEDAGINLVVAATSGLHTDPFRYPKEPEYGCHTVPVGYLGRDRDTTSGKLKCMLRALETILRKLLPERGACTSMSRKASMTRLP